MANKNSEPKEELKFTKAVLLTTRKFENRKDALSVVLDDDGEYTLEEAESLLKEFLGEAI